MTEEIIKNKYVTEEHLDKRLEEQTQVLLTALDSVMEKRINAVRSDVKELREELYIVRDELKKEMEENKDELKRDINNVQTLIVGYVKAQESFRQEFEIMKAELKQMKKILKEKLGLDIQAI